MALQFDSNPLKMKELFFLCKEVALSYTKLLNHRKSFFDFLQILALAKADHCILLRQKTCLLMCAACGLAASRNTDGNSQVSAFGLDYYSIS